MQQNQYSHIYYFCLFKLPSCMALPHLIFLSLQINKLHEMVGHWVPRMSWFSYSFRDAKRKTLLQLSFFLEQCQQMYSCWYTTSTPLHFSPKSSCSARGHGSFCQLQLSGGPGKTAKVGQQTRFIYTFSLITHVHTTSHKQRCVVKNSHHGFYCLNCTRTWTTQH